MCCLNIKFRSFIAGFYRERIAKKKIAIHMVIFNRQIRVKPELNSNVFLIFRTAAEQYEKSRVPCT